VLSAGKQDSNKRYTKNKCRQLYIKEQPIYFFLFGGNVFFIRFFIECPPKYSHNVVSFEEAKHHLLLDRLLT